MSFEYNEITRKLIKDFRLVKSRILLVKFCKVIKKVQ